MKFSRIYVENIIIPWTRQNVHTVGKFSIIDEWYKKFRKREKICFQEMINKKIGLL